MCLAQGPQRSDAGEVDPAALRSQVKHSTTWATALPIDALRVKSEIKSENVACC